MTKYRIIISPQAQRDLKEIRAYTLQSWGSTQADDYLSKIEEAFYSLLENPEIGRERNDVKAGYRSLVIDKHVLFYKIVKSEILILGIPHGRMDILKYFS
ncbi:MAG: type II toxin-antitoxin system RelE/ParE family toxin [Alphaproteobacteria bacterium]|nr:type II toxin-antitoxin system RelE/ParE family toxin [Alphaproteobacteria bacterium]